MQIWQSIRSCTATFRTQISASCFGALLFGNQHFLDLPRTLLYGQLSSFPFKLKIKLKILQADLK